MPARLVPGLLLVTVLACQRTPAQSVAPAATPSAAPQAAPAAAPAPRPVPAQLPDVVARVSGEAIDRGEKVEILF